ncbi:MAG: NAD(P)-dependent alcohol dehydrogenase [Xenococcaceae cyanobacterium MO_188.B29]|nr:NAD(P)-dependent alcohol dehydrogenase [Xenococcaceae cyanobacterium MO_188.B29]
MQVFELQKFGLDGLIGSDRAIPIPGYGEVLVKLKAVSLNYRDLLIIKGLYNPNLPLPIIPLSDGVGEVVKVGENVTKVQTGDRVASIFMQDWLSGHLSKKAAKSALCGEINGVLAEYVIFPEDSIVSVPQHLTDAEAATLPCAGVTAWNALIEGGLKPGDTVLILGTGGVSLFSLQFAQIVGARVIATSSSEEKLVRVKELGAFAGINYQTNPHWEKEVLSLTEGVGVDYIVEVGGAGTLAKSLKAVRFGGNISLIGVLAGTQAQVNPLLAVMKGVSIRGIYVGSKTMFTAMNKAIAHNQIHPIVDRTFPITEIVSALKYLESGSHFGKISLIF